MGRNDIPLVVLASLKGIGSASLGKGLLRDSVGTEAMHLLGYHPRDRVLPSSHTGSHATI